MPGEDKSGYLLPVDASPETARLNGYPIKLLYKNLGKLEEAAAVRVYLEACFSGGSHRGMLTHAASPVYVQPKLPPALRKLTVLTAASGEQLASWDEKAGHGMFTHHLLDALYGGGDSDQNGSVSAGEVKKYLDRHMTRAARRTFGREQAASLFGDAQVVLTVLTAASAAGGGYLERPPLDAAGTVEAASVPAKPAAAVDVSEVDRPMLAKGRVNVRRGPGTKHQKLGQFAAGEEVGITGEVAGGKWLRIDWAEGQHGYVYARLLVASAPSEEPPYHPKAPARHRSCWRGWRLGTVSGGRIWRCF